MLEFFNNIILPERFIPQGHCYLWQPGMVGLHLVSDIAIALAYYSIPVMLVYFVHQRRDVPFGGILSLFSAFTIFCGTTHLLAVWTLWHPAYWLSGFTKAMTAAVSLLTALKLAALIPKAVALPSPAQLEATNRQLENQIAERTQAEEALQKSTEELEIRVAERTAKLKQANEQLHKEIAERKRTEDTIRSLYKVSLARKLSFDQRLQGLLALGRRHFGQDMGAIGRVENNLYEAIAAQVAPKSNFPLAGGNIWNLEQTYCRVTLGAKEPVAFESAGTSHWCTHPAYASSRLEAYIGMPVIVAGKVYGTLSFFSLKVRQNPFTAADKELLKLMAQWVGAEIERQQAEEALQESEAHFRTLVANIPGAVYRCALPYPPSAERTPNWQGMFFSDAIEDISGYPASDFAQGGTRTFASLIYPEDLERVEQVVDAAIRKRQPFTGEYRIVRVDGSLRWVYEKGQGVYGEQGELLCIDGVIFDITSRKRAEEALCKREAQLAEAQKLAHVGNCEFDVTTGQFSWSDEMFRIFGLDPQKGEPTLLEILQRIHPDDREAFEKNFVEQGIRQGRAYEYEFRIFLADGSVRYCFGKEQPSLDSQGRVIKLFGTVLDITSRKQALDALRLSEERYAIAVSGSQVGVWDWNFKTNEIYLTPNLKAMLGYADDEIQNGLDDWDSKVHPDDREAVREAARAHLAGLTPLYEIEHRMLHKDGSIRWFLARATALRDASGKPERLTGTYTNITSRKQAELERDRFFTISVELVCIIGLDGYFKRVNPAFETTLGYTKEELLATPFIEFIHSEDRAKTLAALQKLIAGNSRKTFENRYRCKDGSYKWLAWTGALFSQDGLIYAAGRDITERKQAESTLRGLTWREREKAEQLEIALQKLQRTQAQLVQTEKMAGLGQMVAGIAHEINNPISFIYGNIKPASEYTQDLLHLLQQYQRHYPQPVAEIQEQLEAIDLEFIQEDFPKLLASMKEGAERIREIVLCLRNFSRLDEAELKPVDIHEGIDNTLLLLQHGLKQKPRCREIQVIKEYGQLPLVQCYPSYLNQVFMNLLGNAIDALEEARREESGLSPMIRIRTEVIEGELPDSYRFMSSPTLQRRRYRTYAPRVVIRIIDNGSGITAEIQPRIFDPFFTTKPPGKGTGLGLSISYQIVVDKHGGQLRCHSAPGQGTEFVIELPIVPGKTTPPTTLKQVQAKLI